MGSVNAYLVIAVLFVMCVIHLLSYLNTKIAPQNKFLRRLLMGGTVLGAYSASAAANSIVSVINS